MRFSGSSRILGGTANSVLSVPSMGNSGQCLVLECVARNGIFANVGKPGWSTGCQAVLGSQGRCCSGRVARRNRYSPCALDGAWRPDPSRAPSWPGSPPRPGPSRSPAATSCLLAYCLLLEPSLLRVGPGTPVLVPADQERIRRLERENDDEISNKLLYHFFFENTFTLLLSAEKYLIRQNWLQFYCYSILFKGGTYFIMLKKMILGIFLK